VTGVDFSAAGLARASRLAAGRGVTVDWVQADLLAWQPEPGGYDLVLIYTPALVTAELGGLAIRKAGQVLRPVQTPDGERTAVDTLVRADRPA
jgi:hypothetical protein